MSESGKDIVANRSRLGMKQKPALFWNVFPAFASPPNS
jgi:hypothetical protein